MDMNFIKKQQEYIAARLDSGDFRNVSEVARDALLQHELNHDHITQIRK